ncbi:LOW QUALITY PROTEIN: uncharacterized protein GJ701_017274 [Geothlypis trichas]
MGREPRRRIAEVEQGSRRRPGSRDADAESGSGGGSGGGWRRRVRSRVVGAERGAVLPVRCAVTPSRRGPLANRKAWRKCALVADWRAAGRRRGQAGGAGAPQVPPRRAGAAPAGPGRVASGRVGSGRVGSDPCGCRWWRTRMRLRSGVFASSCLLVQALGVALFLRGFFPVPVRSVPRREARADPPAEPAPPGAGMVSNWTKIPPPLFKKVVIVLIDALRDDFVFGPKGKQFMPYTTQVVEKGTSYSFIAEAKPPTVTMPRIKHGHHSVDGQLAGKGIDENEIKMLKGLKREPSQEA